MTTSGAQRSWREHAARGNEPGGMRTALHLRNAVPYAAQSVGHIGAAATNVLAETFNSLSEGRLPYNQPGTSPLHQHSHDLVNSLASFVNEMIDAFVDSGQAAIGWLSSKAPPVEGTEAAQSAPASGAASAADAARAGQFGISVKGQASAGEVLRATLSIWNPSSVPWSALTLEPTELKGPQAQTIPATAVSFPELSSGGTLTLYPLDRRTVPVQINIPAGLASGRYQGLIWCSLPSSEINDGLLALPVVVTVVPPVQQAPAIASAAEPASTTGDQPGYRPATA